MVFVWVTLGVFGYCFIAGAFYVWLKDRGDSVAEVPAAFWPLVIVLGVPVLLGRKCAEWWGGRAAHRKELDEVRRRKAEKDAADALRQGYR